MHSICQSYGVKYKDWFISNIPKFQVIILNMYELLPLIMTWGLGTFEHILWRLRQTCLLLLHSHTVFQISLRPLWYIVPRFFFFANILHKILFRCYKTTSIEYSGVKWNNRVLKKCAVCEAVNICFMDQLCDVWWALFLLLFIAVFWRIGQWAIS